MRLPAAWVVQCSSAVLIALVSFGATPSPGPTLALPSPSPPPTSTPSTSPSAQPSGPAILDIVMAPQPLQVGKPVTIIVHTTPDVTSVQGRVLSFKFSVPKTGDGTFSGSSHVPWWARFYHGSFHIVFTATNDAGAQAEMTQVVRI
jgi:hypothetical protein